MPDEDHTIWGYLDWNPGGGEWRPEPWLLAFIHGAKAVHDEVEPLLP